MRERVVRERVVLEKQGRVIGRSGDEVVVAFPPATSCSGCASFAHCGQRLAEGRRASRAPVSLGILASDREQACAPGDPVVVALPARALVSATALVYLVPLLALLTGAAAGQCLGLAEPVIIASALAGLVSALAGVRWWTQRSPVAAAWRVHIRPD